MGASLPDRWITDTEPSERFPIYTRGNADEVGPEPFSPLTWSLAWEQGAVPGVADSWIHLGGFRPEEFQWPVPEVFGCWGGYFYNQVSVGRVFGVRMPGGSPDAIDQAYFGGRSDIPPYVPDPRDDDAECSTALGETLGWVMSTDSFPALDEFIAKVRQWTAERPDLAKLSDEELVVYGRTASHRLRQTWDVYAQVVIAASVGPGVVAAIAAAVGRPDAAVAVFSALGGIETAGTSEQIWQLSRRVRSSQPLSRAFDAGVDGLLDRLRVSTDGDLVDFRERFEQFLADHGHRGPNEWDLMPDTWLTCSELALGLVDGVRRQSDELSPSARSGPAAALREQTTGELLALTEGDAETHATLRAAIASGRFFYTAREAGKDAAVRVMLEAKLPFFELGRRLERRGALSDPKHVFMALESELDELVQAPEAWRERLAERAELLRMLAELEPPYIVRHGEPVPPISEWPRRDRGGPSGQAADGDVLRGIAASPGTAYGRARVVFDLSEAGDIEPGDIIVCGTTDPSWVPLFMVAGGVVCEIGAQGSHAAIVSRELGVPCVVSVTDARTRIADGAVVTVDGTIGAVMLGSPAGVVT